MWWEPWASRIYRRVCPLFTPHPTVGRRAHCIIVQKSIFMSEQPALFPPLQLLEEFAESYIDQYPT